MIDKMSNIISNIHIDAIDQFADRVGLSSIAASLGLTVTKGVEVSLSPWGLTDYALAISCIGGVLFIIEKLLVIYLRYKESKKVAKEESKNKKSRNIPK